ncbi:hypothetical protein GCM10027451_29620 [Geodermatophilus aquaeductus]
MIRSASLSDRLGSLVRGPAVRSPLRWPGAAAGFVAAAAYVPVIPAQWDAAAYRGVVAVLCVAGLLLLGLLLLIRDAPAVYVAASLHCRVTVLGLVFTRLVSPLERGGSWLDVLDVVSLLSAAAMAVLCGAVMATHRRGSRAVPGASRPTSVTPR